MNLCDDPDTNALKQGCCLTTSLDNPDPFHNDFKAGKVDRYQGVYDLGRSCHGFEMGDLSDIYLDGFLVADHHGKISILAIGRCCIETNYPVF